MWVGHTWGVVDLDLRHVADVELALSNLVLELLLRTWCTPVCACVQMKWQRALQCTCVLQIANNFVGNMPLQVTCESQKTQYASSMMTEVVCQGNYGKLHACMFVSKCPTGSAVAHGLLYVLQRCRQCEHFQNGKKVLGDRDKGAVGLFANGDVQLQWQKRTAHVCHQRNRRHTSQQKTRGRGTR